MALFTDGPPACIEELSAHDSQLLDIAKVEQIDATQKLKLAYQSLTVQLQSLLAASWGLDEETDLPRVVVTPPLLLWHVYRTLEMFYEDAYHSRLNDRYAGRLKQFRELRQEAFERLIQVGLGLVDTPVSQAALPAASPAPGSPLPDGTYFVAIAWVNARDEEGAASPPVDVTTVTRTILVQAGDPPANATAWNVYVGLDPGELFRQNSSPIGATQTWVQYSPLAAGGHRPGHGQRPTWIQPMPRVLQRG